MAINELVTRALVRIQGDTTDLKAKIKDLADTEKEHARQSIDNIKAQNSALDELVGGYGKLTAGIAAGVGAAKMGASILHDIAEDARLEAAAHGVAIGKVSAATQGLRRETDLLRDAAKLQAGEFKLTTEQVVIAEQSMLQLSRRGHDLAESNRAVTDAIVKLKVDALADLGIHVDKAGLSMEKEADRAELLKRVLGELNKVSSDFANTQLTVAEKTQAAANKIEDSVDKAIRKVKQLAAEGAQGIGIGVGQAYNYVTGNVDRRDLKYQPAAIVADRLLEVSRQRAINDAVLRNDIGRLQELGAVSPTFATPSYKVERLDEGGWGKGGAPTPTASGGTFDAKAYAEAQAAALAKSVRDSLNIGERGAGGAFAGGLGSAATGADVLGGDITLKLAQASHLTENWLDAIAARTHRKSIAEQIIGDVPSTLELASKAFQSFEGVMGDAWTAAVTGADSFGNALKKSAGNALLGQSKELFGIGVKETVLAAASLALGPLGGASASGHAAAAAAAFAGAGLTGALAAELGAGGGNSGGARSAATNPGLGSAPGAGSTGATGQRGQETRTAFYIIGDAYDTETNSRRRLRNAKKLNRRLDRNSYAADH